MSYAAIRLSLMIAALFAAAVGAIRAQPYDAGDVLGFLAPPDGCNAPCWQGIMPGRTSGTEAYRLLNDQVWVGEIDLYIDLSALAWSWSGSQPAWIDSTQPGVASIDGRGVQYIRFRTRLRFGDLWLALGTPDANRVRWAGFSAVRAIEHRASYFGDSVHAIRNPMSCALSIREYWERPVDIRLDTPNAPAEIFTGETIATFNPYDRPYC